MTNNLRGLCSVNGCQEIHMARSFCMKHYNQERRKGKFEPLPQSSPRKCKRDGCDETAWARELCGPHYQAWRNETKPKRKRPFQRRYMSPDDSFNARTEWRDNCLVWTGYTQSDGYGQMRFNGKAKRVHRYAWERVHGEIPRGMLVDHICHTKSCVNIEHLRLATKSQNAMNQRGPDSDNTSGHRNVSWGNGKWEVRISKDGFVHKIGRFQEKNNAIRAAEKAREKLFGEFAWKDSQNA